MPEHGEANISLANGRDEPAPIFVVGMPRSGTTLVSMLLNGHSRISISPETHYFPKYARRGNRRKCLSTRDRFEQFTRWFLGGPEIESFRFSQGERTALMHEIGRSRIRSHELVLRSVLEAYASKHGKDIYGEKTPGHVYFIEDLIKQFRGCKIINVVRDPRDVALSLSSVSWHRGNIIQYASEWRKAVQLAHASRIMRPDQVLSVKFEDVLEQTEDVARQMCAFLNVEFDQTMLSFHDIAPPNFTSAREPWKNKSVEPIDPSNKNKWKTSMEPEKSAIIDRIAGKELDRLGYERMEHPPTLATGLTYVRLYFQNLVLSARFLAKSARLRLQRAY